MELKGKKYKLFLGENVEEHVSWGGGGHYEEKTKFVNYFYKDFGIIEDLLSGEEYKFDFRTREIGDESLKDIFMNTGDVKIPKDKESKLVDLLLENFLSNVKHFSNGFRANIYFDGKPIDRKYLEDKGIIDEPDGQKKIIFD